MERRYEVKFLSVGEVLQEYMIARKISARKFCEIACVSERHLRRIIRGESGLTVDFALKIEKVMPDTPAEFWLSLDMHNKLYRMRSNNRCERCKRGEWR